MHQKKYKNNFNINVFILKTKTFGMQLHIQACNCGGYNSGKEYKI